MEQNLPMPDGGAESFVNSSVVGGLCLKKFLDGLEGKDLIDLSDHELDIVKQAEIGKDGSSNVHYLQCNSCPVRFGWLEQESPSSFPCTNNGATEGDCMLGNP